MKGAGRESKLTPRRQLFLLGIPCYLFFLTYWDLLSKYRGDLPFWGDETFTVWIGQGSWGDFISGILSDVHPPFYFALNWILQHVSKILFGEFLSGRELEYLGVILVALVLIELAMIRKYTELNKSGIAYATIFLVTSAHLLLFMPMMRYYGLAALFVILTIMDLFPDENYKHTVQTSHLRFAITLWLALATSYLTVIVVPAYFVFITSMEKSRKEKYLKSLIITLVCAIPLLILAIYQSRTVSASGIPGLLPFVKGFIARSAFTIYSFFLGEFIQPWNFLLSLPALAALVFLLYLAYKVKTDRFGHLINLLMWISLPLGILVLTFLGIGIEFSASRLTFLAPFFLILLVQAPFQDGITITHRKIGIIAIILLIILNLVSTVNFLLGQNYIQSTYIIPWRQITQDIRDANLPDNIVLHDDDTIEYRLESQLDDVPRTINVHAINSENAFELFEGRKWVTVVFSPSVFSKEEIEALIEENIGHEPIITEEKDYLVEDETSMRWKSMLLGREISKVKKKLIVYNIQR